MKVVSLERKTHEGKHRPPSNKEEPLPQRLSMVALYQGASKVWDLQVKL